MAEEGIKSHENSGSSHHRRRKKRRRRSGKDFDVAKDNSTIILVVFVVLAIGLGLLWLLIPLVSKLLFLSAFE